MWFWTKREREAKKLLSDAETRRDKMEPTIKELKKVYRDNHIYMAILQTLGGSHAGN